MSINNKLIKKLNKIYAERINTSENKATNILEELKNTDPERYDSLIKEMLVELATKNDTIEETKEELDIYDQYVVSTEFLVWTPSTIQGITDWLIEEFEERFGKDKINPVKIFIRKIGEE